MFQQYLYPDSQASQTGGYGASTVSAGLSLVDPTGGILSGVLTGFIDEQLGAVFANGFNLKCWGSSHSPSQAKEELPIDFKNALQWSGLANDVNSNTLNKFEQLAKTYIGWSRHMSHKMKDCTAEGYKAAADGFQQLYNKLMAQIKGEYEVEIVGQETTTFYSDGTPLMPKSFLRHAGFTSNYQTWNIYKVKKTIKQTVEDFVDGNVSKGSNASKMGLGWMALLLGVGWFGFTKSGKKQRKEILKLK